MSRIVTFFLLVALGLSAQAQRYRHSLNFRFSKRHFVEVVPIEFQNDKIYVTLYMEGRPYRFNLDTGAGQGVIYLNGRVPYRAVLGRNVMTDANNRRDSVTVVSLPDFQLGSLAVSGYPVQMIRRRNIQTGVDGILGFDLFTKGMAAVIDVVNGQLILTDLEDELDGYGGYTLKYKLIGGTPHVRVSPFDNLKDDVIFDTGCRDFYLMSKQTFDKGMTYERDFETQVESITYGQAFIGSLGAAERLSEVAFLDFDDFRWANYSFQRVRSITLQGQSLMGTGILKKGAMMIDPFRHTLTFLPYEASIGALVDNQVHDIYYIPDHQGRPTVGLVRPGSEYDRLGFRSGDLVVSVNNRSTPTLGSFINFGFVNGRRYTYLLQETSGRMKTIDRLY